MEFGWAYLVPAIAVAGGITYVILKSYWKSRGQSSGSNTELQAALEASTAASKAILDKLESIETRLGTVEKTLTDIP
jgi:uncharacterized membrane protein YedE/YeeE